MVELRRDDGYELSGDRDRIDEGRVHRWLSTDSYWAAERSAEQMRAALDGSESFGIYRDGVQVAVARVVTDGVVFAYLCDVYVDRNHRGAGLGGWLVGALRAHYAARGCSGSCWSPGMRRPSMPGTGSSRCSRGGGWSAT